ncbi:MAG: ABC transporter permease subunit [Cypionkella sp.]|uniref:amino acid ABC transporter permease n=1 Tax=Cypionkella sp. TaxID=2811411 RepID=UPI002ABA238B|nr:ABC transporter permease subunit [Cypionkella sp.]MDZ4309283.1 ABC transporter permease subunit [Cypionkella sp.]MDZ4393303.1 ABC transporter permease subunit [Cypionkella sp.]
MTLATEPPKANFRLGMLIYDTRYRSYTIQIIVLILFLMGVAWLANNTIENLAAKDKDINFGFLWNRAGYDIDQQLISYTNDSTHFRALLVGLCNTLVVAFVGCFLATILGVIIGVLRLSKNWLVSRLMTVYIEIFRNVPLLLWIILVFVVFSETQPAPKDFRITDEMAAAGQEPAASMILFDSVAITNRGTNVPMPLLDRPLPRLEFGAVSVNLSAWAVIGVIIASFLANRALLRRTKAVQEATGIRPTTWWKSLLILFVPTIALLLAMGFHLDYPTLQGFNFRGGLNIAHSFTALTAALTLYYAAVIAETVRAGIQAISRGQSEASAALGLRPGRTMNLVILPQALRVIIPPLISQYLSLTKDTSLGIAVSYLDLRGTLGGITLNQTGRELECMTLMMLIYLIISLIISTVMNIYNASVKLKER